MPKHLLICSDNKYIPQHRFHNLKNRLKEEYDIIDCGNNNYHGLAHNINNFANLVGIILTDQENCNSICVELNKKYINVRCGIAWNLNKAFHNQSNFNIICIPTNNLSFFEIEEIVKNSCETICNSLHTINNIRREIMLCV